VLPGVLEVLEVLEAVPQEAKLLLRCPPLLHWE